MSVTVRLNAQVKTAIAAIPDHAWQTIEYTDAVYDEQAGRWISRAEVAEVPFTAFTAQKKSEQVPGRLVVRRIPDLNTAPGQGTLFDTWRFHAFFTTTEPGEERRTRAPALGQVRRFERDDREHQPGGVTRAAAAITGPVLARATTATIRRKLIAVPARVASSARRITLHLPAAWPWEAAWTRLFTHGCGPPTLATT